VVNDATKEGTETGSSMRQALHFQEIGLNIHDTMTWEKGVVAFPESIRYNQKSEFMFILSKGVPAKFNGIKDHKNVSAGRKVTGKDRDDNGFKDRSGLGKECPEFSLRGNVWHIWNQERGSGHPAPFPHALASDHIQSWSNPGDVVLDPFAGSGTTLKAAKELGRRFVGIEINAEYVEICQRRIAQEVLNLFPDNVSDQTPRTQDVANTTDSLERLSASVLFGLLLLVGFISGPSSVGAQETPIDHPRPAESHRTTDKMDNTGNPIILGNEAEPRLEALSADTYGKSAFGSFGEPSPQTSGTAHSALESSLTDQVGSLSGGERASESTMQARRLSPTGFVLLGVIVQLLLMAATWSNVVPVEHPKWLSLNIRYTAVAVLITMLLQPYVLSLVSSLESSGALIHCPNAEVSHGDGSATPQALKS